MCGYCRPSEGVGLVLARLVGILGWSVLLCWLYNPKACAVLSRISLATGPDRPGGLAGSSGICLTVQIVSATYDVIFPNWQRVLASSVLCC